MTKNSDKIYGIDKSTYQKALDMNKDCPNNFFNMGLGNVLIANGTMSTEDGTAYLIFLKTSKTVEEILNPPSREDFTSSIKLSTVA